MTTHPSVDTMPLVTMTEVLDLLEHPETDPALVAAACLLVAHRRGRDVGETIADAGGLAAGTLRGVDVLLENRPGSWEADLAGQLIGNTVGHDPADVEGPRWRDTRLDRWRPARRFHAAYGLGEVDDPIPDDVTHLAEAWTRDSEHVTFGVDYVWRRAHTPNGDGWIQDGNTDEDEDGNTVDHRPLSDEDLYVECDELVELPSVAGVLVIA